MKINIKQLVVIASLGVILLIPTTINAKPSSNPVYATIMDVQESISNATAPIQNIVASLLDKISSLEINQTAQTSQMTNLETAVSSMSAQIANLSTRVSNLESTGSGKAILDNNEYNDWNSWSNNTPTDAPTPVVTKVFCRVACTIHVSFYTTMSASNIIGPPCCGGTAYFIIYVDGVRSRNYQWHTFRYGEEDKDTAISLGGLFPVTAGNHTVQIYSWENYLTITMKVKILDVIAFSQ